MESSEVCLIDRYKHLISESIPVPLYFQVVEVLRRFISDNEIDNGHRIPSEKMFAKGLGVGRQTVNKAFNLLMSRGVLSRIGRKGCIVAKPPRITWVLDEENFAIAQALNNLNVKSRITLISSEKIEAIKRINRILRIEDSEPLIALKRMRHIDEQIIQYSSDYFQHSKYKKILEIEDDVEFDSIVDLLSNCFNEKVVSSKDRFVSRNISARLANYFGCMPFDSCLTLNGVYYDENGTPLTYHETIVNDSVCCIEMTHTATRHQ